MLLDPLCLNIIDLDGLFMQFGVRLVFYVKVIISQVLIYISKGHMWFKVFASQNNPKLVSRLYDGLCAKSICDEERCDSGVGV